MGATHAPGSRTSETLSRNESRRAVLDNDNEGGVVGGVDEKRGA